MGKRPQFRKKEADADAEDAVAATPEAEAAADSSMPPPPPQPPKSEKKAKKDKKGASSTLSFDMDDEGEAFEVKKKKKRFRPPSLEGADAASDDSAKVAVGTGTVAGMYSADMLAKLRGEQTFRAAPGDNDPIPGDVLPGDATDAPADVPSAEAIRFARAQRERMRREGPDGGEDADGASFIPLNGPAHARDAGRNAAAGGGDPDEDGDGDGGEAYGGRLVREVDVDDAGGIFDGDDASRLRNMLKSVGSRLLKPKLVAGIQLWKTSWREQQQALKLLTVEGRMKAEIDQLKRELEEARIAMLEGRGQEAELQRQMEERMAAEREKRIEHTKQQAIRRIGKRDLTRGWVAWYDQYEEHQRQMNALKFAGAKLLKPKLVSSIQHWKHHWEVDRAKKATGSLSDQLAEQREFTTKLTAELANVRQQLADARQAMMEGRGHEVELQRQMEEDAARAKAERIQDVGQKAMRRILRQDLVRGWQGWFDFWEEQARQQSLMKGVGARLAKPKLVASIRHWRHHWEAAEHAKRTMSMVQQLEAEKQERQKMEWQMAQMAKELESARKAMMEGRGLEAELQRQMEERLAAEKEKRIEHTKEQALRRIGKRDLTRGWVAWHDGWFEEARMKRALAAAATKLVKPKLVACVTHWRRSWEAAEGAKRAMSIEQRMAERLVAVSKELEQAKKALAAANAAGFDGEAELRMQQEMEERLAAEREKRIEHTKEMAVRRIARRDLAKGWVAWYDQYEEHQRQMNALKFAGAKLLKPKLVAGIQHWKREWQAEQEEKKAMSVGQRLKKEQALREQLQVERLPGALARARTVHAQLPHETRGSFACMHTRAPPLHLCARLLSVFSHMHTPTPKSSVLSSRKSMRGHRACVAPRWRCRRRSTSCCRSSRTRARPRSTATRWRRSCSGRWRSSWPRRRRSASSTRSRWPCAASPSATSPRGGWRGTTSGQRRSGSRTCSRARARG